MSEHALAHPLGGMTFTPTEQDLLAADKLAARSIIRLMLPNFIVFVIVAVIGLLALRSSFWLGITLLCGAVGGIVGGTLAASLGRLITPPRKARRIFAQQAASVVEINLSWDEECICGQSVRGSSIHKWTDFYKRLENDKVILLYRSEAIFNILPKRALSSKDLRSLQHCAASIPSRK